MRPILLLILAEAVCFGPFVSRLGFYHDDWVFLELFSRQDGYWACVRAMWDKGYGIRPMDTLLFPAFFAVGGFKPLAYHLLLMSLDALGICLFFLLLKDLLEDETPAFLAAALALILPVHAATHHWFANMPQTAAQDLLFASLLLHRNWLRTRRGALLAGSMAAYVLGMLAYESVAFLPLLLGAGLRARRSLAATAAALAPYAAALLAALLWEKVIAARVFDIVNPKTASIDFVHIIGNYRAALACLTLHLGGLLARAKAFWPALAGLIAGAAWRIEPPPPSRPVFLIAAVAFAAAYAPYALSGAYSPEISGAMSRINGAGGLAAGLFLAGAAGSLGRARGPFLGAVLFAGAWTNWYIARQWGASWTAERAVFDNLSAKVAALPGPLTIILQGTRHVEDGLDFVFQEDWGLTAALQLKTRRSDVTAVLITAAMRAEAYGVVEREGLLIRRSFPYQNLYIYDFSKDSLSRPTAPAKDA